MRDHIERFGRATRAVGCYSERLQRFDRGFKEDFIIIDDQRVHRLKHHILSLPIRNRKIQQAVLGIRKKYGKNAMLKGVDFEPAATTRERNRQIGGHKSGE